MGERQARSRRRVAPLARGPAVCLLGIAAACYPVDCDSSHPKEDRTGGPWDSPCPERRPIRLVSGECVECATDDDCEEGENCYRYLGDCTSVEPELEPDDDGFGPPYHCFGDEDCADGEYCDLPADDAVGLCRGGCRVDPDNCPASRLCSADTRECHRDLRCQDDRDCESNEYCRRRGDAIEGECADGCRLAPDSCPPPTSCQLADHLCHAAPDAAADDAAGPDGSVDASPDADAARDALSDADASDAVIDMSDADLRDP